MGCSALPTPWPLSGVPSPSGNLSSWYSPALQAPPNSPGIGCCSLGMQTLLCPGLALLWVLLPQFCDHRWVKGSPLRAELKALLMQCFHIPADTPSPTPGLNHSPEDQGFGRRWSLGLSETQNLEELTGMGLCVCSLDTHHFQAAGACDMVGSDGPDALWLHHGSLHGMWL